MSFSQNIYFTNNKNSQSNKKRYKHKILLTTLKYKQLWLHYRLLLISF